MKFREVFSYPCWSKFVTSTYYQCSFQLHIQTFGNYDSLPAQQFNAVNPGAAVERAAYAVMWIKKTCPKSRFTCNTTIYFRSNHPNILSAVLGLTNRINAHTVITPLSLGSRLSSNIISPCLHYAMFGVLYKNLFSKIKHSKNMSQSKLITGNLALFPWSAAGKILSIHLGVLYNSISCLKFINIFAISSGKKFNQIQKVNG